jgi:hypothetical protein
MGVVLWWRRNRDFHLRRTKRSATRNSSQYTPNWDNSRVPEPNVIDFHIEENYWSGNPLSYLGVKSIGLREFGNPMPNLVSRIYMCIGFHYMKIGINNLWFSYNVEVPGSSYELGLKMRRLGQEQWLIKHFVSRLYFMHRYGVKTYSNLFLLELQLRGLSIGYQKLCVTWSHFGTSRLNRGLWFGSTI